MPTVINVKCIRGNVLIEPIYPKHKGEIFTGHLRPDDLPSTGRVVAMPGRRVTKKGVVLDYEFGVGDVVVMKRFTCHLNKIAGRELITVKAGEILAVVTDEKAIDKI